ncbi:MAG TPA: immunoglobulin domain-containing protein, partial [Phototrophicaceae bacterium]|nr:immunoglobulin domain-containing protein [Phototrophicaceae bacterium]
MLVLEHIMSVAYCFAKHGLERLILPQTTANLLNKKSLIALLNWLSLSLAMTSGQTLNLPPRPDDAPSGLQFVNVISRVPLTERENWIFAQVMSGNVPEFLRSLVPINVSGTINGIPHAATYYVTPDYLAIGTDADYFLEPMTPLLAQRLCNALGCTLPTRKMVNQIWTNAPVKLNPQPIPPSAEMITVPVFAEHNFMVRTQRDGFTNSLPLGALVSGDKKDVIISSKIYTNFANTNITRPVVIYGWHYPSGSPIQPLYNGHEETYADYSHGVRLVQNGILLDGNPNTITNILTDSNLAGLLSDEGAGEGTSAGVIRVPRYTLSAVAPVILIHPRNQTVSPGANLAFHALAAGDAPLRYRWLFNGVTINGETNATLLVANAQTGDAGNYA